jgi:hypothetical protein
MPVAAVDKHCDLVAWEHKVGSASAGEPTVKPEPEPGAVQRPPQQHLGLGVLVAATRQLPTLRR